MFIGSRDVLRLQMMMMVRLISAGGIINHSLFSFFDRPVNWEPVSLINNAEREDDAWADKCKPCGSR